MDLFYAAQLWVHMGLLTVGLWLNRDDMPMFILTAAVGTGFYAPIASTQAPFFWYAQCFLVEIGVAFAACMAAAGLASRLVLFCAGLLAIAHLTGAVVGPQPGIGPYRGIIPILELAQFLVCIALSRRVLDLVRRALPTKAK